MAVVVAVALDNRPSSRTDRVGGVVVELAAGNDGQPRIQEPDEQSRQPRLGLPSLAEEDQVVPGQDRVLDRGNDQILVADDAWEGRGARRDARKQIRPQLRLDRPRAPARGVQLRQGGGPGRDVFDGIHGVLPRSSGQVGPRA